MCVVVSGVESGGGYTIRLRLENKTSVAALWNCRLEESPGADGGCLRFHFSVFQKLSRSGSPLGLAKITHRQK